MCGSVNDLRSKADVKRAIKTSVASMQVCCLLSFWIDSLFVSRMYSHVKQRDCKYEKSKMGQC